MYNLFYTLLYIIMSYYNYSYTPYGNIQIIESFEDSYNNIVFKNMPDVLNKSGEKSPFTYDLEYKHIKGNFTLTDDFLKIKSIIIHKIDGDLIMTNTRKIEGEDISLIIGTQKGSIEIADNLIRITLIKIGKNHDGIKIVNTFHHDFVEANKKKKCPEQKCPPHACVCPTCQTCPKQSTSCIIL